MTKKADKGPPANFRAPEVSRALGTIGVSKPLQAYLEQALGQVTEIGDDVEGLWQITNRGMQMETAGKILAGRALSDLRERLPRGDWLAGLAKWNVACSTAYDAMDAFKIFDALPDLDSVRALAQVGVTKARALKDWSADEHKAFASGKAVRGLQLDEAVEMSSRDLIEKQRDWQIQNENQLRKLSGTNAQLQTQVDTLQNEVKRLIRGGAGIQTEEDLPPFARAVRQEAMALTEAMSFSLDGLQAVAEANLFTKDKIHADDFKFKPIAAGTMYYALAGIQARAQQLLQRLAEKFGESVTGQLTLEHQLTAPEIARFTEQRAQLLATHQAQAKRRENERENTRPGKRGAKRK